MNDSGGFSLHSCPRRRPSPAPATVFMVAYVGLLVFIDLFATFGIGVRNEVPGPYAFWTFWYGDQPGTVSLLISIMSLNVLAAVFLWVSFRSFRESMSNAVDLAYYAFYVVGAVLLVAVQIRCYQISTISPDFHLLVFPQ